MTDDIIYGKAINENHMIEELGDVMWFVWKMTRILKTDLTTVMEHNRKKLLKRYKAGFSEEAALAREDKEDGER